jgi:hypothetical protein
MSYKLSAPEAAFSRIQALMDSGKTAPEAVKAVIAADPSLAGQITLEEVDLTKTLILDAPAPVAPPAQSSPITLLELHTFMRDVHAKGFSDGQQDSRLAELEARQALLENTIKGTAGAVVSHLVQHQEQMDGKRELLSPGETLRVWLEQYPDERYRAALIQSLPPEAQMALENAITKPVADLPVLEEKVIPVEQKPARKGIFG